MAAGDQIYCFNTSPINLGITTALGRLSNHAEAGNLVVDPVPGSRATAIAAGYGLQLLRDSNGVEISVVTATT